jgi:uncharacterized protein YqhQ
MLKSGGTHPSKAGSGSAVANQVESALLPGFGRFQGGYAKMTLSMLWLQVGQAARQGVGGALRRLSRIAVLPFLEGPEEILIGGQAVIEGVMMRSPHSFAVAVRKPDGGIALKQEFLDRPSEKHPWLKKPLLRGLGVLGQAMVLGIRALRYSAEAALAEDASGESGKSKSSNSPAKTSTAGTNGRGACAPSPSQDQPETAHEQDQQEKKHEVSNWVMAVNLALSLGFFILFYKFLPLYIATLLRHRYVAFNHLVLFNFIDGIIRIVLFLGFLTLIAQWKDIKRLFEYHGAEHKVVWAFEKGRVDLSTARACTRFHPRCGTSFLLVVMAIAMLLYLFLPFQSFLWRFVSRIALLPVIAGVSYEFIRYAAKSQGRLWKWAAQPGLWLQGITTREPDDNQLEIAIRALESAMELEKARDGELVVA